MRRERRAPVYQSLPPPFPCQRRAAPRALRSGRQPVFPTARRCSPASLPTTAPHRARVASFALCPPPAHLYIQSRDLPKALLVCLELKQISDSVVEKLVSDGDLSATSVQCSGAAGSPRVRGRRRSECLCGLVLCKRIPTYQNGVFTVRKFHTNWDYIHNSFKGEQRADI